MKRHDSCWIRGREPVYLTAAVERFIVNGRISHSRSTRIEDFAVSLVKVTGKYQVTLPSRIRARAGVAVGDLLEARVEGKKITLVPKRVVDRELARALEDVKRGRVRGPFSTAEATVRALRRTAP